MGVEDHDDEHDGAHPPSGSADASAGKPSVLLVEDEEVLRSLQLRVLSRGGYRVRAVKDGTQGLDWLRREPFELLITDLELPGISGRELARLGRAVQPGLRVLFVSGRCDDLALRRELQREGQEFLEKPFGNQDLLDGVQRALARPPGA